MTCLVRTDQVAYRYTDDQQGLHAISTEVEAGEALLVTGPSGCGKSTLARCLTGLIPHLYRGRHSGDVWLDGLRTVETPLWQLAEHAGMVFQNPTAQMLASTVEGAIIFGLENLGLPREDIHERLESTLQCFDLHALRDRVPQTLSGGEQHRLWRAGRAAWGADAASTAPGRLLCLLGGEALTSSPQCSSEFPPLVHCGASGPIEASSPGPWRRGRSLPRP